MSHDITIREDGFAEAAFALTPAWHGLGKTFDHAMTSAQAIEGAGLDWSVLQSEAMFHVDGELQTMPGSLVNYRSDNGEPLGIVSDRYQVIQNTEGFEFLDELVDEHEMRYESAFSLRGGKQVVLLAQLPKIDWINQDDPQLRFILLSLSHDGTGAVTFGPVSTRVVCANTYAIAEQEGTTSGLSIRHQGKIAEKLDDARAILAGINREFDLHSDDCRALEQFRFDKSTWREYLNLLCPNLDPRDPDYSTRRQNAIAETRLQIQSAYYNERQAVAAGTAWAAYNAVSEHIDHTPRRGQTPERRAETRFNVCLSGVGLSMKKRAFELAKRFAEVT